MRIKGPLVPGYQVDSGTSKRDTRFAPQGTIRMQEPFFLAGGLDFQKYFNGNLFYGTLNVELYPQQHEHLVYDYRFDNVHWTPLQPAENFFMSEVTVYFGGKGYKGLLYTPDPATKPNHFQVPSIIQFLAEWIPGLSYGDELEVELKDGHIKLSPFQGEAPAPLKDSAR